VGSNFGTKVNNVETDSNANVGFGGQLGYLWNGVLGIEALADFAPSMEVATDLFVDDPRLSSYMANAIGAVPLGSQGQIQPYFSAGFGTVRMRADVLNILVVQSIDGVELVQDLGSTSTSESRWGGNIGAGLMGFAGDHFGFRTDVRYYRAMSDDTPDDVISADTFTRGVLSGLEFWRANVGLALRW
jgi:opacity protein-like surface antigen